MFQDSLAYVRSSETDRVNVIMGKWRIFIVLLIGIGYSLSHAVNLKWFLFWVICLAYAGLWLVLMGKHTQDRPNALAYMFVVGDVVFFTFAFSFEQDILTNYSTFLILPLFQYLLRYGRKVSLFYCIISALAIIYVCILYPSHPVHHFIIIIIMLLITFNEGFLIEENNNLKKELYGLVMYDELTGLYNYRYFYQSIEKEFNLATRLNDNLALALLDIDGFKKINDTHGHEAGNLIIREIARIIKENVRDCDYACKYGGDEFVIILPHTEAEAGLQVAERIREAIRNHTFVTGTVTVSMGIADFPINSSQKDELIDNADKALYNSKVKGKDMVTIFNNKETLYR